MTEPTVAPTGGNPWNIPNLLSVLRLIAVPVFLWAILTHHDVLAVVILVASGLTDWLDGKIARAFNMTSRLGELLDPIADRLYIVTTILGLGIRGVVPWWLVVALLGRDVLLAILMAWARRFGIFGVPVQFVGKMATFALLCAFPVVLLPHAVEATTIWARPLGWALMTWGLGLYWFSAVVYAAEIEQIARANGAEGQEAIDGDD